jgi:glycosyltransferase involved in cell wall biosynthesis
MTSNTKSLKISIITICYNSDQTIETNLNSVAKQTYKNYEHLVIDGKSDDNSISIVRKFPHVKKIISEKDEGIYHAMNKGI